MLDTLRSVSAEVELLPAEVPGQLLYSEADSAKLAQRELGANLTGSVAQLLGPDGQLVKGALSSVARCKPAPLIMQLTTEVGCWVCIDMVACVEGGGCMRDQGQYVIHNYFPAIP